MLLLTLRFNRINEPFFSRCFASALASLLLTSHDYRVGGKMFLVTLKVVTNASSL